MWAMVSGRLRQIIMYVYLCSVGHMLLQFTLAVRPTLCTHLFFGEDVAFGAGLKWLGDV